MIPPNELPRRSNQLFDVVTVCDDIFCPFYVVEVNDCISAFLCLPRIATREETLATGAAHLFETESILPTKEVYDPERHNADSTADGLSPENNWSFIFHSGARSQESHAVRNYQSQMVR